jgi:hypothetical protein
MPYYGRLRRYSALPTSRLYTAHTAPRFRRGKPAFCLASSVEESELAMRIPARGHRGDHRPAANRPLQASRGRLVMPNAATQAGCCRGRPPSSVTTALGVRLIDADALRPSPAPVDTLAHLSGDAGTILALSPSGSELAYIVASTIVLASMGS